MLLMTSDSWSGRSESRIITAAEGNVEWDIEDGRGRCAHCQRFEGFMSLTKAVLAGLQLVWYSDPLFMRRCLRHTTRSENAGGIQPREKERQNRCSIPSRPGQIAGAITLSSSNIAGCTGRQSASEREYYPGPRTAPRFARFSNWCGAKKTAGPRGA